LVDLKKIEVMQSGIEERKMGIKWALRDGED